MPSSNTRTLPFKFSKKVARLALLLAVMLPGYAISQSAQAEDEALKSDINAYYESHLSELFLWFHQNPELGFLEQETAARLTAELRALGIEVTEGVGGTGLVGIIENGSGPLVLLRADMDGLPIEEKSGLANASRATQPDSTLMTFWGSEEECRKARQHHLLSLNSMST